MFRPYVQPRRVFPPMPANGRGRLWIQRPISCLAGGAGIHMEETVTVVRCRAYDVLCLHRSFLHQWSRYTGVIRTIHASIVAPLGWKTGSIR